ncbi:MAG: efflux RND transporter periplasmic adaptor subunit [Candidatus Cloacimonetes bacterium]|nr:efflux RND transporter periplasmic adaptor subunit [Candidatus Cloacimonadota bacterium]
MKPRYIVISVIMVLLLALSACGKKAKAPTDKQDERPVVIVEELALRDLDEYVSVSGKLEGITDITMSSEASGRILQLYKKLGDRVAKGERIGQVENDALRLRLEQAEAALVSAQSSFDNAQKNLSYAETAWQRKLISQAEYNSAMAAFKGAKAGLDGAKAGVESASQAVRGSYLSAPEAGVISNLLVAAGQYIAPGTPVASITNASRLILKTGVGESQISKIKQGQAVELSYPGMEESFKGQVRGFGIRPVQSGNTYPIEIETSGGGKLLPGMVVSARILSTRYKDLLYTPITNVVNEFGKNYVYIVDAATRAQKMEVTLGRVIGENVEILSGLQAGDKVVTSGADNLESGTPVQIRG